MLEVTFLNPKDKVRRKIEVEPGENLREAAIRHKFGLYPHIFKVLNCRGRGLCTSCTVEIVSGEVEPMNEIETEKLKSQVAKKPGIRLSCQVKVTDNLTVRTRSSI